MELIEIKGLLKWILVHHLRQYYQMILNFYCFYADKEGSSTIPQVRNTVYDTGIFALKFKMYLKYTFGLPGEETIQGHPYSKLGLQSHSFYELRNSDLIKSLQEIENVHPEYNPERWKSINIL